MKKLIIAAVVLVALAAGAYWYLRGQEFSITLTEEQLQTKLDELFPVERKYLLVIDLTLSDPEVRLVEGAERIHGQITATASVQPLGREVSGSARISGGLRYDPESRHLFLVDSRIEEMNIEGLPPEYHDRIRELADLAVREQLNHTPVYTLEEETLSRLPGPIELRGVGVAGGRVKVSFGLAAGG